MKVRTVVRSETIMEQHVTLSKEAIRKRIKMEKSIAAGINLGAVGLSAAMFVKIGSMVYETLITRNGLPGGEILVFPGLCLTFWIGYKVGTDRAVKSQVCEYGRIPQIEQKSGTGHAKAFKNAGNDYSLAK
ncbi:MAG: hypothetical protein Q4C59_10310 [Lachnospiraceae bacterium]|nr:hypothetical protein [Lachnospiraceae bacterium]